MPNPEPSRNVNEALHKFTMVVDVFGPIRPAQELNRRTQRAIKGHVGGRDYFTDITLREARNVSGMRVEYLVTALSPAGAERAGVVYLSQLCDLVSVVTRSQVWFYMPDEDSNEERMRAFRRPAAVDRVLTEQEWSWITGSLVFLRREHARFLAAASWYRKGLLSKDSLDGFCCYWRVIERLALSYCDKGSWTKEEQVKSEATKCVQQLMADLFDEQSVPEVLRDQSVVSQIVRMRNDISHGNEPITLELIDRTTSFLKPLEDAAYRVLHRIRVQKLISQTPE